MNNLSCWTRYYLAEPGLKHYKYDLATVNYKEGMPVIYMNYIGDGNCSSFYINKACLEKADYFFTYVTKPEIIESNEYEFAQVTYGDSVFTGKRYYVVSGISEPLKIGQKYMMSTGGKSSHTDPDKIHGTNCRVTDVNISKETVLAYMEANNFNHLYIIDTQYRDEDAIYDNKYYMPLVEEDEDIEAYEPDVTIVFEPIKNTHKKIGRIKPGINPETGELYLWELARERITLGMAVIGHYDSRLNKDNAFNSIGALCYSLLEKGNDYTKIYNYLKDNKLITNDSKYSKDQLTKYFYYSSMYYCDHSAEYNYMMSSLKNVTTAQTKLVELIYLHKLPTLIDKAAEYICAYDMQKNNLLQDRENCINKISSTYDKENKKIIYEKLDLIDDQLNSLENSYSDLELAKKVILYKEDIEKLLDKLL